MRIFRVYLTENFTHKQVRELFSLVAGSVSDEPNSRIAERIGESDQYSDQIKDSDQ